MKKILAISYLPPMPDQQSGDLRFFSILQILTKSGQVTLAIRNLSSWRLKTPDYKRYESMFMDAGITLFEGNIFSAINSDKFDLVIFEFYYSTTEFFEMARYFQPHAILAIDTVDVHFNRMQAKAALTGEVSDKEEAQQVRSKELNAYQKADVVIAVSEDDKTLLKKILPNKYITVLPNVHIIHEPATQKMREFGRLIFIGGLAFSPNIDAVLYFLTEVMPIIRTRTNDVKLSIIGSNVPQEIINMASQDVEIIGYVPDTTPYLQSAYISIAPLRYGGGMKGKVGEAMSHGLPVVTTRFGAEGFGLIPGVDLLVAETPDTFADAIVKLLDDTIYYNKVSDAGYCFIKDNYSPQSMQIKIESFLELINKITPLKSAWHERLPYHFKILFERYIGWRF